MKRQTTTIKPNLSASGALARLIKSVFTAALLPALLMLLLIPSSHAGSATWSATPLNGIWNKKGNWVPQTIPNRPQDTATFATSSITAVSLSTSTGVNGIVFSPGANAYTISTALGRTVVLTLSGSGITNNSGITQNFVVNGKASSSGVLDFTNSATAGTATTFTIKQGLVGTFAYVPLVEFFDTSSAGSATFVLEGSSNPSQGTGGEALFYDDSTADSASFTIDGGHASSPYVSGGFLYYGTSASSTLNGNFTINGATGSSAYGGSATFDYMTNLTLNGTFTINGGALAGAGGATVYFYSSVATFNGPLTINGGGQGGSSPAVGIYPTTATVNGVFTLNGGTANGASGGNVTFSPGAVNLGAGNVVVNGGTVSGAFGAQMTCQNFDVGVGAYTANGGNGRNATGGYLYFYDTPGVSGTLIANSGISGGTGGIIIMSSSLPGTMPRLEAFGNGTIDLNGWSTDPQLVGSIEGTGLINGNNVSVGSNNLDTTFSGVLGIDSLTKVGTGTLTLSSGNTYSAGTTINGGTLLASNSGGSGTGTGSVLVDGGALGGTGIVSGAVTVGVGSGPDAFLAPGNSGAGTLTIKKPLTFAATATYRCELDSNTATADKVVAKGVSINNAALIVLSDTGTGVLPLGTVFTVIDNSAATPIAGAFSNLADGSTLLVGSNNYQVSYEGGTGNDLTLTVVP